jgi:hypothetical protein
MKNSSINDVNGFSVVELTQSEKKEISGGWFWIALALVAGLASAVLSLIEEVNKNSSK